MSEAKLILGLARREAAERARSRGFRVSTVVLLIAAGAAVVLPTLFGVDDGGDRVVAAVAAPAALDAALTQASPPEITVDVQRVADRAAAEAALSGGEVDAAVVGDREVVWRGQPDGPLRTALDGALTQLAVVERAEASGMQPAELQELLAPPAIETTVLEPETDLAARAQGPAAIITLSGVVLLFVSVTFYGSYILLSVIEEKQNRVVEVLLAHVRPRDLLAGKVLGHGLLGLGQMTAIGVVAVIGLTVTDAVTVPRLAYGAVGGVLLWFLLGYAFYSILYAALGSLASRTEDAQSAVGPLTVLLMVAYFATFTIISDPTGVVAVVGSFLPPTAPLMMPVRTALTDVPAWQVLTAVVIEVAAIVGLVWLGGRLYRGAVLRIGPKLSLREAWRATG